MNVPTFNVDEESQVSRAIKEYWANCRLCGQRAWANDIETPAGVVVGVILCDHCDRRGA
ncbi:MAG: hypothetical protein ACPHCN_16780 [Mycobacterium sp.]